MRRTEGIIPKLYYTTEEVDDILGYSAGVTRVRVNKGHIKASKIGRDWVIPYQTVQRELDRRVRQGRCEARELPE